MIIYFSPILIIHNTHQRKRGTIYYIFLANWFPSLHNTLPENIIHIIIKTNKLTTNCHNVKTISEWTYEHTILKLWFWRCYSSTANWPKLCLVVKKIAALPSSPKDIINMLNWLMWNQKEFTTLPYVNTSNVDHKVIINVPLHVYLWRSLL